MALSIASGKKIVNCFKHQVALLIIIENLTFKVFLAPGLQHEPKLKSISLSATLNRFVSGIVAHIIELILLKEVGG